MALAFFNANALRKADLGKKEKKSGFGPFAHDTERAEADKTQRTCIMLEPTYKVTGVLFQNVLWTVDLWSLEIISHYLFQI